jgi:hypothetical protein
LEELKKEKERLEREMKSTRVESWTKVLRIRLSELEAKIASEQKKIDERQRSLF